ncbi:3-phosphoshikimate 1-carboxyvinyltransferase [Flavobacteriaceae bacterium Ap0902]|nr:3-phosphoshikimate 1-carboxyvinyltransferase [Flavobacteriaceae bacterium Ap0902]
MINVSSPASEIFGDIYLAGSKSESNRWLILQALYGDHLNIHNLSNSKDTEVLKKALHSKENEIDVNHAGTAMRFLISYFATQSDKEVVLTGSNRMQERPIGPLVEALKSIGADISYMKHEGYPPLRIKGKALSGDKVSIQSNISSQYISSLLLVASSLPNGLSIHFKGELTSKPYVEMTVAQLESLGIKIMWLNHGIKVSSQPEIRRQEVFVESDWSSASYWYSMATLSEKCDLTLKVFKKESLQGDAILQQIYSKHFGIETRFVDKGLKLSKKAAFKFPRFIEIDLNNAPDIAQTIIVTCAGLGIKAKLLGLHTLKVKETDRLVALKNELEKIGVKTRIDEDSIEILSFNSFKSIPVIETYQDHRMAMSFAPLALKFPIQIKDEEVVVKSYPNFWKDLQTLGFIVTSRD